ncbi:MAG TPA: PadR family transcriptional regulator [Mycobacteriales bacterium]|nr:PadR family transcriptional regulator [Mycobacteriales bacterium]
MSPRGGQPGGPGFGFFGGRGFGPGDFPFGPGFWGPQGGRRRGPRAGRGDVRAGILALLAEEPRNGYQIIQELQQRSGGAWRVSPGSVYPALSQLEDEGLIVAEQRDSKRVFTLTDAGREYVEEHQDETSAPWNAFTTGNEESSGLHAAIASTMIAAHQVTQAGSPAQIAEAKQLIEELRRALYGILAEGPQDSTDEPEE